MSTGKLAGSPRRQVAVRLVSAIIGAAIGFVIVWLVADVLLAGMVGCGVGFLIGWRLSNRSSTEEHIRHDVHGGPIGGAGRGGTGDWGT